MNTPSAPPLDLPREMMERPTSIVISGRSRLLVQLVAYAFAERIDPSFFWMEISPMGATPDPEDGKIVSLLPAERVRWIQHIMEVYPDPAVANISLFAVVREDTPGDELSQLADFLTLPPPLQQIVSRIGTQDRPDVIVVANGERLGEEYPFRQIDPRRVVATLKRENVSLVLALRARPFEVISSAFDAAFRIESTHAAHPLGSRLIAERLPLSGDWPTNEPIPMRRVVPVARLVRFAEGRHLFIGEA
jgi:hypothetical protein